VIASQPLGSLQESLRDRDPRVVILAGGLPSRAGGSASSQVDEFYAGVGLEAMASG
jgi:hypothetical protein